MGPIYTALMIPFLGTALGSAFVFFMKRDMPALLQKVLLGFASGVMVAAAAQGVVNYFQKQHGTHTIDHAEAIGLGTRKYHIVIIDK